MKLFLGLILILTGVVAFRTLSHPRAAVETAIEKSAAITSNEPVPVIVELFTSEGCSSCPPADEVLSKLDKMQSIQGVEVIALGEHVDYWNKLGWIDPYSSGEFSQRQSRYSDAFKQDSVYTPQMIVDGRDEFAGGNMDRARTAIANAAQSPKAHITIASAEISNATKARSLNVSVQVRELPRLTAGDTAEVLLAITENNLRSEVSRGENAGRYLKHSAVVRQLTSLGTISQDESFAAKPTVDISNGWLLDNLRAVVFVQERGSRRILGSAALGLSKTR